ncbi:MAG: hypothetical protein PF689_08015 [Deltaproteobacteria bacterium]|nr:hypothetical protein [Deltaproteobacteria bacterium]
MKPFKLQLFLIISGIFLFSTSTSAQSASSPEVPKNDKNDKVKQPAAVKPEKKVSDKGASAPVESAPITKGTAGKRKFVPQPGKPQQAKLSKNELKLRQLAELVEDLKNKVTATKYRLQLLKEAMITTTEKTSVGGSKLEIVHHNKMGGVFRMVRLRYFLDGKLIQSLSADNSKDKALLSRKKIKILTDHVSSGNKRVRVFITYKGNGYGIFQYVKNWKWEVHNTYTFAVEPGKMHLLEVIGKEKGGMTTPLNDRPVIKFKLKSSNLTADSVKKSK